MVTVSTASDQGTLGGSVTRVPLKVKPTLQPLTCDKSAVIVTAGNARDSLAHIQFLRLWYLLLLPQAQLALPAASPHKNPAVLCTETRGPLCHARVSVHTGQKMNEMDNGQRGHWLWWRVPGYCVYTGQKMNEIDYGQRGHTVTQTDQSIKKCILRY